MSLLVTISGRAEVDLTLQYRWYVDNANVDVADRFLAAFDATVTQLAKHLSLGRPRKFRAPELRGIRSFPVGGPFGVVLVFYRFAGRSVAVERVMHGARDLPRRLLESPQGFPAK